jgi:ADP-heptose:LPS heptosyltransferase
MNMNRFGISLGGGLGKHVAFSALTKVIAEKYGDVILVNAYPDVFLNNPHIHRNFTPQHPYLYEDYLRNISVKKAEPYECDSYRLHKKHLLDVYAEILGLDSAPKQPLLFLSPQEDNEAVAYKTTHLKNQTGKTDYILVQIFGGVPYYNPQNAAQKNSFARDLPVAIAQVLADKLKLKYPNHAIIQIGLNTEPQLKGVINMLNLPNARVLFSLVKHASSFIAIDSSIMHIAAAFNRKGIVLWGGTSPEKLGYDCHVNLENPLMTKCKEVHCHRPETYFFDIAGAMRMWDCPYQYECMQYDVDYILDKFQTVLSSETEPSKITTNPSAGACPSCPK